jgi:hypothetical protein
MLKLTTLWLSWIISSFSYDMNIYILTAWLYKRKDQIKGGNSLAALNQEGKDVISSNGLMRIQVTVYKFLAHMTKRVWAVAIACFLFITFQSYSGNLLHQ